MTLKVLPKLILSNQPTWEYFLTVLSAEFHDKDFISSIRPVVLTKSKTIITGSPDDFIKFSFYKLAISKALEDVGFSGKVTWKH